MTCRDFQYEEGKDYGTNTAKCCDSGFHACEYPLDCFEYYSPNKSVYHEVDQRGEFDRKGDDSKVASTKIHIGARLDIAGMVKAAIEFTMSKIKPEAKSDELHGASSATGDYGASSATGYCGASSATGYKSCSEAKDPCAIAVAWGYHGRAKGVIGSYLVIAEWEGDERNYWTKDLWTLKGAKMERVDGERIKADTWYTMKDGEFVAAE